MGEILYRTKLSEEIFNGLAPWLGWLPGRLMHVNILGCGIFGSVSGSSAATCATIAKIALPELKKRGYDEKVSLGSLAGAGTLDPEIGVGRLGRVGCGLRRSGRRFTRLALAQGAREGGRYEDADAGEEISGPEQQPLDVVADLGCGRAAGQPVDSDPDSEQCEAADRRGDKQEEDPERHPVDRTLQCSRDLPGLGADEDERVEQEQQW